MTRFSDHNLKSLHSHSRLGPALLLYVHIIVCCLSLIYVAEFYSGYKIIWFDEAGLYGAALNVALFAIVSILFTSSRFSFGYFVGFYFYTMILGYLWIAEFSKLHYDHPIAALSAFVSAVAFLVPALFITSPIRQRLMLSTRDLDVLLSFILILAAAIVAIGAFYNFRLVGLANIYSFRDEIDFPAWLRYPISTTSNALLPFAFACFVARENRWRAAATLLLLLLFYPITLTKLTLFAPFWLLFLFLLSRLFDSQNFRRIVIVSAGIGWSYPGFIDKVRRAPVRAVHHLFWDRQFQDDRDSVDRARHLQRLLFDPRSHPLLPDYLLEAVCWLSL